MNKRRTLILHGALAEKYGRKHQYHADNVKDLIEGVNASNPGLADEIKSEQRFGFFVNEVTKDAAMSEVEVHLALGDDEHTIHIYPAIEGDKSGLGSLIIGVAIIGLGVWTGGAAFAAGSAFWSGVSTSLISMGASMALSGAMMYFADTPTNTSGDGQSIFSQNMNVATEGGVVPLWYGHSKAQGVLVDHAVTTDVVGLRDGGWDDIDDKAEFRTKMIFVVSEGECDGPATNGGTPTTQQIEESVYIKGVQMYESFDNSSADYRKGTSGQSIVPGYEVSSQTFPANLALDTGIGKTIDINSGVDSVKLNVAWTEGMYYVKDNGGYHGSTTGFNIHVNTGNGFELYQTRKQQVTAYKPFVSTYEVLRPAGHTGTWTIKLTRLGPSVETVNTQYTSSDQVVTNSYDKTTYPEVDSTPESNNASGHKNEFKLDSYIEVKSSGSNYANSAYYAMTVTSEDVDNVLNDIYFVGRGRDCWMAHNYNPASQTHSGSFNGSLKQDWTNNPAYVLLDLLYADECYGKIVDKSMIDLPAFYRAALWCDAQGFEYNGQIFKANNAVQVMNSVASVFLGKLVQTVDGKISLTWAGESSTPIATIGNSDVVDGHFQYTTGNINTRTTSVVARWNNPEENYDTTSLVEQDDAAVASRGVIPLQLELTGVTNQTQARTIAEFNLKTNSASLRTIDWVGSWNHANYTVGDIVTIDDDYNNLSTKVKIYDTELSNAEEGLFTFKAIEFDSSLYAIATGGGSGSNVDDDYTYKPSPTQTGKQTISAVVGLSAAEITSVEEDNIPTTSLFVEWSPPTIGSQYVTKYYVTHRFNDGVVSNVYQTTNTSYTIPNTLVGIHQISVVPVGIAYNRGPTTTINYELRDRSAPGSADSAGTVYVAGTTTYIFDTQDLIIEWDNNANIQNLSHYWVEFHRAAEGNIPETLMKSMRVEIGNGGVPGKNQATLLYADNKGATANGTGYITTPQRKVKAYVYAVDNAGRKASPRFTTFYNYTPPAPTNFDVTTRIESAEFSFNESTETDLAGYLVRRKKQGSSGSSSSTTIDESYTVDNAMTSGSTVLRVDQTIGSSVPQSGTVYIMLNGASSAVAKTYSSRTSREFTLTTGVGGSVSPGNTAYVESTTSGGSSSGAWEIVYDGLANRGSITGLEQNTVYEYAVAAYDNFDTNGLIWSSTFTAESTGLIDSYDNYTIAGLEFSKHASTNKVSWSSATVRVENSADGVSTYNIYGDDATWSSGTLYIYYVKGSPALQTTTSFNTAIQANSRLLALYKGGNDLTTTNENGSLRDGNFIYEGTIGAAQIKAGTIQADSAIVAYGAIDTLRVADNAVSTVFFEETDTAHALSYDKGNNNTGVWIHTSNNNDAFLHALHGYHYYGESGWTSVVYSTRPSSNYRRTNYSNSTLVYDFPKITFDVPNIGSQNFDVIVQVAFELGTSTKSNNKYCVITPELEYYWSGLSGTGARASIGQDAHNSSLSGGIPFIKSFVGGTNLSIPPGKEVQISLATDLIGSNPQVYGSNTTDWLGRVYNYVLIRNITYTVTMLLR